jgi:hypothetical protein
MVKHKLKITLMLKVGWNVAALGEFFHGSPL